MPNELSQITLPNNTTYDLKDSTARTDIGNKPGQKVASGTTTTYDETTYTTSDGCEIFNDLTYNRVAGNYSHAEGYCTKALGSSSHTEGRITVATGSDAHAEGFGTTASGDYSHASGAGTIAASSAQTAIGKYNVSNSNDTYAFVIGNGTAYNARSNAFAIDWDGKVYPNNAATGIDLSQLASEVPQTIGGTISIYNLDPGWWTRVSNLGNVSDKPSDYSGGFICHVINTGLGNPNRKMIFFYPVSADYTNIFYIATQTSSGWSSWAKYENKEQTIISIYGTGTAIATGQDLNNFTTLGSYNCNTGTIASSLYNCPTESPFRLEVSTLNGSTRYVQKIYVVNSATSLTTIFIRSYTSSGWTGWNKIGDDSALIQYINNGPKNVANPLNAQGYDGQGNFPIIKGSIKYTLNANGTITTENTASATTTLKIPVKLVNGETYTISGCPSGGTSTSYRLDIRLAGTTTVKASDYGDGAEFTATQENYDLCIRYQSGQAAAQTFSPMICLSAIYALTPKFVQYIPSNAELYAMIQAL